MTNEKVTSLFTDKETELHFNEWCSANADAIEEFDKHRDELKTLYWAFERFWYERVSAQWINTLELIKFQRELIDQAIPTAREQGIYAALLSKHDTIKAGESQKRNLKKGNPAATISKAATAEDYHEKWKTWAKETWKANPFWGVDKVASHVLNIANENKHKMANGKSYQIGTIIKEITGVKESMKPKK